jgi:hypothetical protein
MTATIAAGQTSGNLNVLFQEPTILRNIDSMLFVGTNTPADQFAVVQWPFGASGGGDAPVSWSVGDVTGFYRTNLAASQRGVSSSSSSSYGSTAVQVEGGTIGILIDSNSLKNSGASTSTLFPILPQFNFSNNSQPAPFAQPGQTLVYSLDAQIPTARADNVKSFAYATMYFNFHDPVSRLNFWYRAALFDSRGASMAHEMLNYDNGTKQAIVEAVIASNGQPVLDRVVSNQRRGPASSTSSSRLPKPI